MPTVTEILDKTFKILEYIHREGEVNQLQISKDLGIRYQTVGDYLEYLERFGLIESEMTRTAPPMKKIVLTDKGKCLAACFRK